MALLISEYNAAKPTYPPKKEQHDYSYLSFSGGGDSQGSNYSYLIVHFSVVYFYYFIFVFYILAEGTSRVSHGNLSFL